MRDTWKKMGRLESLSPQELQAWQLDTSGGWSTRFETYLLSRAVPAGGYSSQDIQSLQDFSGLPAITKEDINANLDKLVRQPFVEKPTRTRRAALPTAHAILCRGFLWRWNIAQEFRGRSWYGVHPGDKIAWVWGAARICGLELEKAPAAYSIGTAIEAFGMTEAKMQASPVAGPLAAGHVPRLCVCSFTIRPIPPGTQNHRHPSSSDRDHRRKVTQPSDSC